MKDTGQSFGDALRELAAEQPITAAVTYGLSGLDRQQLAELQTHWNRLPVTRRRQLLEHLNLVSEANFELDYRDINHFALQDADPTVRRYAIEGLWEDESMTLLRKLVRIVRDDPSMEVRVAAMADLGRFILLGEYEEIPEAEARLAQDTVLAVLHSDEDIEIRRRALEAIANCGREGVHDMIAHFYAQEDLMLRVSAVFAMGRTCDERWAQDVLREMDSEELELRYEAARAAGQLEIKAAIPHLIRLIDETDDVEIIEMAIWALGEIGGEKAQQVLEQIMRNAEAAGNDEIAAAADDALQMASLPGDFLLFDFEP
ncbi:MAG: HEAT repeat domain-containing protein [Anaerolineae bacterium]|nr:HEAT repeat domain-containing protein [Anaerolineae bacterium]